MTVIKPPPISEHSIFWDIADIFDRIASTFDTIGTMLSSFPIFGNALNLSFHTQGSGLRIVELGFRNFDDMLVGIKHAIEESIAKVDFQSTFASFYSQLVAFQNDPQGVISSLMGRIIYQGTDFLVNPAKWVNSQLNEYFDWFNSFTQNPQLFIHAHIKVLFPDFDKLVNNPVDYILDSLEKQYQLGVGLITAPLGFLTNWINTYFPELILFNSNPLGYIISKIKLHFNQLLQDDIKWLIEITTRLLNQIW